MKIKDIVSIVTPPAKIPNTQYSTSGIYPIIDQGQDYIAGYTNDAGKTITGNFILFGDHTCAVKLPPRTFAQGADGLKILKCKDGFDTGYIYYAIRAMNYNDGKYRRHWSEFKELTLPTPTLSAQRQISTPLLSIDKVINANHKLITSADALINLIYNYWFVQFDFPGENGRPYKSSGGKMIYDNLLKQEIPEGWKAVKFSSIAKIISGFPFKSDNYVNSGKYKVITIRNVQDGSIDSSTANSIDSLPDNLPDECVLSIDDLLISLTGNVGRCGLVFENNLLLNQRVGKLVVDHELNKDFAISTISSLQQRKRMEQLSNGSSQANLSPIQAADFYIALPPQALLNKFNSTARPARQLSLSIQQESKQLASLRDWLLPMLMNGQVEIRNDQ